MSYFAEVKNGTVTNVIVADKDFIDSLANKTEWLETCILTRGNKVIDAKGNPTNGTPLRGNYAGIGFSYESKNDVFIPPQPFKSWTINKTTWRWESPSPMPSDETKYYQWDESSVSWKVVTV